MRTQRFQRVSRQRDPQPVREDRPKAPYTLSQVISVLELIAPLDLAASWDNVGLLVPPVALDPAITKIFLTIDLTEATLDEALLQEANLIVSYHPPIFEAKKRWAPNDPRDRLLLRLLRSGVGVFSPHTSLDAARGGMTDWLAASLGRGTAKVIDPHASIVDAGMGRIISYRRPLSTAEAIVRLKRYLATKHLRVATPGAKSHKISSAAFCPGAGGSVLMQTRADLLVTGEMRHHDVMMHVAHGRTVILADHTNTERGYLPLYARALRKNLPKLPVTIARSDADPLVVC